ncbi:MAG: hypothetical protein IJE50_02055 [Clostridia bacterium]|nr:hypothetical protein [Clostridia bacterium]MBQ3042499.1 hypothetical protein [Clostridia bacterium]
MDYGKFTSAEELLKGYNALEKSFTQKCQQLSTLQKQLGTSQTQTDQTEQVLPPVSTDDVVATIPEVDTSSNGLVPTDEQLQQYLESNPQLAFKLLQAQVPTPTAPTVMTGGGTMSLALPSRPKTIKEATLMAQKLFE